MADKDIHAAIAAIMTEVGYVQKERKQGLNYSFAGEAALIAALRPAMVAHGVYCFVSEITNGQSEQYSTTRGTQMISTVLTGKVRFVHAPSGTSIDVTSRGEGADAGDKSSNKAMTGLYKYALRQTFCIETGDDPDNFASEERASSTEANNGDDKKDTKKETKKKWPTQADLVGVATSLGIETSKIGPILRANGYEEFDATKYDGMVAALKAAVNGQKETA